MFIRVTNKSGGLADYLRKGKGNTRDDRDVRIPIYGDINAFEQEVAFLAKHRKWSSNYKHITFSLSGNDEKKFAKLNDEEQRLKMQEITFDYLRELFPHRDPIELTTYIEAHQPKVKYEPNKENLLHWHAGVSLLDHKTGNRLKAVSNVHIENVARLSKIAARYGLDDPITFIDFEANKNNKKLSQKGKIVNSLSEHFRKSPPDSYDEVLDAIDQWNSLFDTKLKIEKEGSGSLKYLTVKPILPNGKELESIRLKGKNFRSLEPIYAEKFSFKLDPEGYKTRSEKLKLELQNVRDDERFRESLLNRSKKRFLKSNPNREYSTKAPNQLTESAAAWRKSDYYIKEIEHSDTTNTQRAFYRLYSVSLRADVLGNSKCFIDRDTKHKVIWQPEHKVRLVDSGQKITTDNLSTDAKRLAAVHLMLEMAEAKGWPLDTLNFSGDSQFLEIAERERAKRIAELAGGKKVIRSLPDCETGKQVIIKTNPTDKFTQPPHSKERISKTKAQIDRLKRDIDERLVIELLSAKGVSVSHVTINKKRHTVFVIKGKRFNGLDALTKLGGYKLDEAMKQLEKSRGGNTNTYKPEPKNRPRPTL
jgi:hypothetical protein